jgi:hypothetical protein
LTKCDWRVGPQLEIDNFEKELKIRPIFWLSGVILGPRWAF